MREPRRTPCGTLQRKENVVMTKESKPTILCVDDERDIVDSLFDTFMDDYNVKIAGSGKEALEIFDAEDVVLVITDQRMPEMEGTELLAVVKEKKSICKKILLTGYADVNAAIDAINKGSVDRYFSKPWDDEELTKAVKHLVSMYDADKFLYQMQKDGERINKERKSSAGLMNSFKTFLDGYHTGVCIVGDDKKIEFMNKKGLEIMQYKDVGQVQGTEMQDIFLVDDYDLKKEFQDRYTKNDMSPVALSAKLPDGTEASLQASMMFEINEQHGGAKVSGVIFNKPSNIL